MTDKIEEIEEIEEIEDLTEPILACLRFLTLTCTERARLTRQAMRPGPLRRSPAWLDNFVWRNAVEAGFVGLRLGRPAFGDVTLINHDELYVVELTEAGREVLAETTTKATSHPA